MRLPDGRLVPLPGDRIGSFVKGWSVAHTYPRSLPGFGQAGWVSWQRGRPTALTAEGEGRFSLFPLKFKGRKMILNYRAKFGGHILVEAGGPQGNHTFAQCDRIIGDELNCVVTWRGEADLGHEGTADRSNFVFVFTTPGFSVCGSNSASMARTLFILMLWCPLAVGSHAVVLERVISRENPLLGGTGSRLAVGRDGRVYVASDDYVVRMNPDGTGKTGGKVTYAMWNLAANADGIFATANAHFSRSVNLWAPDFQHLGKVGDFLSNDATEWWGPCDVQAGAGGDFYAADQNRERIVRIGAPGKIVTTYPLAGTGETFVRRLLRFRVCESLQRFSIATDKGEIHALGFDGQKAWTIQAGIGGNPWDGYGGDFDVDEAGNFYVLKNNAETIQIYGPDGKPGGEIHLQMGDRKGTRLALRLWGNDVFVKRANKIELFQVYARNSGALKRVVNADVEQFRVEYPSDVWTAGASLPLSISLESSGKKIAP